jgi:hypothetical protein
LRGPSKYEKHADMGHKEEQRIYFLVVVQNNYQVAFFNLNMYNQMTSRIINHVTLIFLKSLQVL